MSVETMAMDIYSMGIHKPVTPKAPGLDLCPYVGAWKVELPLPSTLPLLPCLLSHLSSLFLSF
jgi:hypothetical protein